MTAAERKIAQTLIYVSRNGCSVRKPPGEVNEKISAHAHFFLTTTEIRVNFSDSIKTPPAQYEGRVFPDNLIVIKNPVK